MKCVHGKNVHKRRTIRKQISECNENANFRTNLVLRFPTIRCKPVRSEDRITFLLAAQGKIVSARIENILAPKGLIFFKNKVGVGHM